MAHNILVWIETFKGQAVPVSYECLGEAQKLADGGQVTAAVFGENAAAIASFAIACGADRAIVCEDATFAEYRAEPYIALLAKVARDLQPDVIMAGASTRGRDVSSGLAVELEAGAIADCIAIEEQGDQLIATRPVYAGKLLSHVVVKKAPVIITTRSRAFPMPEAMAGKTGEVTTVAPVLSEDQIATKPVGFAVEGEGEVSLNDARIIVSGGRGVGGPEGFAPIVELARTLGARCRGEPCRRRRRLDSVRVSSRPDRQDRRARSVHCQRHQWRDSTPGRHAHRQSDRRRQQRSGSAHFQAGALRSSGRSVPDCARAECRVQEATGKVVLRTRETGFRHSGRIRRPTRRNPVSWLFIWLLVCFLVYWFTSLLAYLPQIGHNERQ